MKRHVCGFVVLVMVGGCSSRASSTEPAAAAELVRQLLSSWQKGEPSTAPRERREVAAVGDQQWESGWQLERFELRDPTVDGFQARVEARLWLKDPHGKRRHETAEYVVTLAPARTMIRTSEGW